jgi:hypothetical protein
MAIYLFDLNSPLSDVCISNVPRKLFDGGFYKHMLHTYKYDVWRCRQMLGLQSKES